MTDKEVRRLKRADLLEILFYLQKETDALRQENDNLRQQLASLSTTHRMADEDLEQVLDAVKTAVQEAVQNKTEA